MEQPRLDHHYIVMHLGGLKRVCREGEGVRLMADVALGSLTVVPAGSQFSWRTEGPIDFAHFYVRPRRIERVIVEEFDREPAAVAIPDIVGQSNPLLQSMYAAILDELADPVLSSSIYLETLYHTFLVILLRECSTLPAVATAARYALAPHKLRRVKEYVESNLGGDIDLAAMAEVANLSRYHFCRVFQRTTGTAPHAFVAQRRIEASKRLLRQDEITIAEIARLCGFASPAQFATTFRRFVGKSPSGYRRGI